MRLTLIGFLVLCVNGCFAQGYKLDFKIDGLKDLTLYLGYYYGESTFVKDTAKVNDKGEFVFDGKQPLAPGVYFLVKNSTKLPFEMVISNNQKFSMKTDTTDYVKNMVVSGDEDNKLFFQNMVFNYERHKEAEPFLKILQDTTLTEDQKKEARESFSKISQKVEEYQDDVIAKHPNTLTARILKSQKQVKIPDPPKKADGTIDSTFQLRWYRQHFFDNFDLADEALIRMPRPVYHDKVEEYLTKLFVPQADSIDKAMDFVIEKAKKNQETYKYAVWLGVMKYQSPDIMGLDAVYVHLFDKYFASGQMDFWVNDKMKKNLKDQADRFRKSLIGKTGPNLIMLDNNLKPKSLYDLKNKYTILYIFDPDCGHCKEETPKLVKFYEKNKTKFDLEVYAVSADTSMAKMRDYIKTMKMSWITVNGPRSYVGSYQDLYDAMTTPTLYILDSRKKIIGKKIASENLEGFFTNYEKSLKAKDTGKL
jgi:thiol-disulfide isomerase/thioredoxin